MALLVGLDPTGLHARTADEFENILAAIQTWVGKQEGLNAAFESRQAGLEGKLDAAVPTGALLPWTTSTAPSGFLLCNGAAVDRTTYGALFAVIGVIYGTGNGSTTFNVPDLRQRFPLGLAASGTGSTLAGTGGTIDHTHTGPSHSHTIPATDTEAAHTHTFSATTGTPSSTQAATVGIDGPYAHQTHTHAVSGTTGAGSAHSHTFSSNTGAAGTGATGTGNPPFIAMPYIIKT